MSFKKNGKNVPALDKKRIFRYNKYTTPKNITAPRGFSITFWRTNMNDTVIILISADAGTADILPREGFSVRRFSDTEQAVSFAESERVDAAVVDGSLDALQKLRGKFTFPVIMLSSGNSEAERIAALMLGADDVITKPFGASEAARIRSLLQRKKQLQGQEQRPTSAHKGSPLSEGVPETKDEPSKIAVDELCINILTHKCLLGGAEIRLTPSEFNILWYLCLNRGRVVSGKELFEAVWGEQYLDSADTLMPHIARLRRKLGEPARSPRYIKTVWGVGYKID